MYQDYKDLLSAFQSHGVKYLIVGGFAVIYHAQPRFTKDLDLFIKPDPANAIATYAALAEFGTPLQGIRPDDFTDRNNFFRFGRDPNGFDILSDIPGVDFNAAWERRVESVIDEKTGLTANFISAADVNLLGAGSSIEAAPPDYAFDLAAHPGQYSILANVMAGPEAYAIENIDVTGNVNGLVLAMTPPPDLTATVLLAESDKQINFQGVRVTLNRIKYSNGVLEAKSDARGKLVFSKPIVPGHYSVEVSTRSLPEGCFVKAVKFGGQEVSADDFEIQTSAHLEIILSNKAATITGSVADEDGKPFGDSTVTLIPSDGKSRPAKLKSEGDGSFTFTGLSPGSYKLFAWEEVDDGVWQDPEFRSRYEDHATNIAVSAGETRKAQLRAITAGN